MRKGRDSIILLVWTVVAIAVAIAAAVITVRNSELAYPAFLWAALLLVPVVMLHLLREGRRASHIRLSTLQTRVSRRISFRALLKPAPFAAGIAGTAILLIALARPQNHDTLEDVHSEGIDIVIALDISASMLAKDLKPDRLEASKQVAKSFIDGRPTDRIGLVVYEGEAFTQCPITTDHGVLKELFTEVRSGLIDQGTAVGMGLATALNRLRESTAKSKVVILLTDGVNNKGTVQPIDAAMIAEELGIRVYAIGVGTRGKALSPVARYANGQYQFDYVDVDIDEKTLQQIATTTGGQYFRATDERKLKEIYAEIDRMEKTRIEVQEFSRYTEEFHRLALLGTLLLLAGFVLDRSLLHGMA